jgi:hypothetical protein
MDTHTPPTLWEVPDDVWTLIAPLRNACYSAKPTGHRRVDRRPVLHGLIFRRRTGGPWHQRPKPYGDDSPVPRHCQPWAHAASGPAGGPCGSRPVRRWAGSTGRGKPPTPPGVKPGGAATGGVATRRTMGTRGATAPRGGRRRWATGRHQRGGQRPRPHVAGRHAGGHGGGASSADRSKVAAFLPGPGR